MQVHEVSGLPHVPFNTPWIWHAEQFEAHPGPYVPGGQDKVGVQASDTMSPGLLGACPRSFTPKQYIVLSAARTLHACLSGYWIVGK